MEKENTKTIKKTKQNKTKQNKAKQKRKQNENKLQNDFSNLMLKTSVMLLIQ